jgi:hypothetical protein
MPTMRFQGGRKPEDWRNWGAFSTFKSNAADLLLRALRPEQAIYCSLLVDPDQPAEESERIILDAFIDRHPRAVAIQTRGPA